jgi:THO complex subunit 2
MGRFLHAVNALISRWHLSATVYAKECACFPGFVQSYVRSGVTKDQQSRSDAISHDDFRHVCHKWQLLMTKVINFSFVIISSLTRQTFIFLLDAKEYTLQRNAFLVLSELLPYFPRVKRLELALNKKVQAIAKIEDELVGTAQGKMDIRTLCKSYIGRLMAQQDNLLNEVIYLNVDCIHCKQLIFDFWYPPLFQFFFFESRLFDHSGGFPSC